MYCTIVIAQRDGFCQIPNNKRLKMHETFPLTFTTNQATTSTKLSLLQQFTLHKTHRPIHPNNLHDNKDEPCTVVGGSQCKPWQRLFGHPCSLFLQAQSHSHCTGRSLFNKSHLTWAAGSIFQTTLLACFVSRTFGLPHPSYQYIMYVIRLVKSVGANLDTSLR